jgi:hypothetical protein
MTRGLLWEIALCALVGTALTCVLFGLVMEAAMIFLFALIMSVLD